MRFLVAYDIIQVNIKLIHKKGVSNLRRHKKLISILIIFCLLFQLIPVLTCYSGIFQDNFPGQNILPVHSYITDILYIGKENQKPLNQHTSFKDNFLYTNPIFFSELYLLNFSLQNMPFDHRRVIRQSIPDYFNGSKYKGHLLVS